MTSRLPTKDDQGASRRVDRHEASGLPNGREPRDEDARTQNREKKNGDEPVRELGREPLFFSVLEKMNVLKRQEQD